MTPLETFCRQVRSRSAEHRKAITLLHGENLVSQTVGVLRQEVDSMVRIIYLLSLSDLAYRNELVQASVEHRQWTEKGKKRKITDREMVELANQLQGWTESVYRFGCAFIHLSSFHDYQNRDPMSVISDEERTAMLKHMMYYHGGPSSPDPSWQDVLPYLPKVFDKISMNLEHYIEQLETQKVIHANHI